MNHFLFWTVALYQIVRNDLEGDDAIDEVYWGWCIGVKDMINSFYGLE